MKLPYNDESNTSICYSNKHFDTFRFIMLNNEVNKQCKANIYEICTHPICIGEGELRRGSVLSIFIN